MSFIEFRTPRINNIKIAVSERPDVTIKDLRKLHRAYKDYFKGFRLEEKLSLKEAYYLMIGHLSDFNICDVFTNGLYDCQYDLTEIHYTNYMNFAKIELYPIYRLRKNKEIFEVLVYILNLLSKYIPLPNQNEFLEEFQIEEWSECEEPYEKGEPAGLWYFVNKEYQLQIKPFCKLINDFEKTFTHIQILSISDKYPEWKLFIENSLNFLKKPSRIYDYCFRFPEKEMHSDYPPLGPESYWGFMWGDNTKATQHVPYGSNPHSSSYDIQLAEHIQAYVNEGGEIEPIISIDCYNKKNNSFNDQMDRMKLLFTLLNT